MGSQQSNGGAGWEVSDTVPALLAAAHELKSPLVLIRQLTFSLDEHDQTAERIRMTAERSLQLVESLTRAARLDDMLFVSEPINMTAMLDDVAHELQPLARALEQTIEVHAARSPLVAVGNRELLRAILLGLCDNALTHNAASRSVELRARQCGEAVCTGVRDYGPRTSQLAAVLRKVGKTPLPMDARPRSSGLGLMIAEQFARHMDASLHLRRHRDAGATFSLTLPVSQQLSFLTV